MLEMTGNIVFRCILNNVGYWMASFPNLQLLYRGQVNKSYRHLAYYKAFSVYKFDQGLEHTHRVISWLEVQEKRPNSNSERARFCLVTNGYISRKKKSS